MSLLTQRTTKKYISVLSSDGTFRLKVDETTPGAVKRDYETSTGEKGVKWELVFSKLEGLIKNIQLRDGDYGQQVQITVDNNGEQAILSLGVGNSHGEDFLKKLPNLDFSKPVSLEPFTFENDQKRTIRGINIKQDGEKVKNYYWNAEEKEALHGFPEPEGDVETYEKPDWKIHFLKVNKFLVAETAKLITDKFSAVDAGDTVEYPTEDSSEAGGGHF